jgi:hypothetical protein
MHHPGAINFHQDIVGQIEVCVERQRAINQAELGIGFPYPKRFGVEFLCRQRISENLGNRMWVKRA